MYLNVHKNILINFSRSSKVKKDSTEINTVYIDKNFSIDNGKYEVIYVYMYTFQSSAKIVNHINKLKQFYKNKKKLK